MGIMIHLRKDRRFIAATFAFALCANAFSAEAASLLLVLNKGDNTLAIVDAATLQVKGHVPSGPDPHEVVASADGRIAYISNYNQGNGAAGMQMDPSGSRAFDAVGSPNSVAVIDLKELKLTQRIETGPGPDGLAWAELK